MGIWEIIISVAAVLVAISNIWNFVVKPLTFLSKKAKDAKEKEMQRQREVIEEVIGEKMPKYLEDSQAAIWKKHEEDNKHFRDDLRDELKEVSASVKILIENDEKHSVTLEKVTESSMDILREKIMNLYHLHEEERCLKWHEREALDRWYQDYKKLGGNSYIDKYYKRMAMWRVLDDNYRDDKNPT